MEKRHSMPPGDPLKKPKKKETPIPKVYPVLDNDLARDNIENDIPAADLQDMHVGGSMYLE